MGIANPARRATLVGVEQRGGQEKTSAEWAAEASTSSRATNGWGGGGLRSSNVAAVAAAVDGAPKRKAAKTKKDGGPHHAGGAVEGTAAATPSPGALTSTVAGESAATSRDRPHGAPSGPAGAAKSGRG